MGLHQLTSSPFEEINQTFWTDFILNGFSVLFIVDISLNMSICTDFPLLGIYLKIYTEYVIGFIVLKMLMVYL